MKKTLYSFAKTDDELQDGIIIVSYHLTLSNVITHAYYMAWVERSVSSVCLFVRSITQQEVWLPPTKRASAAKIN